MATPKNHLLRAVFMGTPAFAAVILKSLLDSSLVDIVSVFTQPDRPAKRTRCLCASPVKQLALDYGIPVFQPKQLHAIKQQLVAPLTPEICLVAAYGLILPQAVLEMPKYGCINVHASLLPRYRGAAPIQRAILEGATTTGISIIQMNSQLDAGDILHQYALDIGLDDTSQTLHEKLACLGARLLLDVLDQLSTDTLHSIPQDHSRATHAPKLTKEEGLIQWNRPALEVHNHIRGLYPWPGSWFFWEKRDTTPLRLTLQPGHIGPTLNNTIRPGYLQHELMDEHLAISCKDRWYLVPTITPEGKTIMDAKSFYNGYLVRSRN